MLSGIITAILIAAFCGICVWAWSAGRRKDFEAAASMPLEDDEIQTSRHSGRPQ